MIRFALLVLLSLAVSSQALAAVKWNNSGGSSNANKAWIPEIKTQLHDLDISNAKFIFVNEQLEKSLALFPQDEFELWGTQVDGIEVGESTGPEKRTVDCETVLKQMRPVGGADSEAIQYMQNCSYHYQQNLFDGGLTLFQKVLDYWSEKGADIYSIDKSSDVDGYAKRNAVAALTTTYSLFYNHFTNHEKINNFINDWVLANQTIIRPNSKRCPYEFPPLYRQQKDSYAVDSCGSNNWRTAVAAIAFGLRTNNKDVYIAGVKQFEINISMYDEDGIFVPYASRGWDAPGYAVGNDEYISALAILFNDIDFDLYQLKVKNGQTVANLTIGHTKWLENPSIAEKYILGTLTCNGGVCEPFTNFSQAGSLAQWKIDRQFEAHDIQLRQLYYLFKNRGFSPSDIEAIALNFPYSETLPNMYVWGQTSSFPTIFITLNQAGKLGSYLEKSLGILDLDALQSKLDSTQGYQGKFTCDLQIKRTLKSSGEKNVIMTSSAVIENGNVQFTNMNWQTGNNQNWEDISTKQNLVIAEDGKLIGLMPIFTMFGNDTWELFELGNDFEKYGNPTTPEGISKAEIGDVQLEFELRSCSNERIAEQIAEQLDEASKKATERQINSENALNIGIQRHGLKADDNGRWRLETPFQGSISRWKITEIVEPKKAGKSAKYRFRIELLDEQKSTTFDYKITLYTNHEDFKVGLSIKNLVTRGEVPYEKWKSIMKSCNALEDDAYFMEIPIQSTDSDLQSKFECILSKNENEQIIDLIQSMIFAGQFMMNNYK